MARKPSSSHRGNRTSGIVSKGARTRRASKARRTDDTKRGEASRTRAGASETAQGQRRASATGRSGRAKRADEKKRTPDQQAATRGRSDRAPDQRGAPSGRLAGGPEGTADLDDLRPSARKQTTDGETGTTETSSEHQGMGRGHRRNFDESDDDATTRGQSAADAASDAPDSGVPPRLRATDPSIARRHLSPRGGRYSGHRSDW